MSDQPTNDRTNKRTTSACATFVFRSVYVCTLINLSCANKIRRKVATMGRTELLTAESGKKCRNNKFAACADVVVEATRHMLLSSICANFVKQRFKCVAKLTSFVFFHCIGFV